MNSKWNYQPPSTERQQQAKELAEKLNTSPVMAQLLIQRGIRTESAAKRFLRPLLSELIDPFLMNDMDIAVDRLNDAMGRKERIMVYGDYDVDGCTAVALVFRFLQQFRCSLRTSLRRTASGASSLPFSRAITGGMHFSTSY